MCLKINGLQKRRDIDLVWEFLAPGYELLRGSKRMTENRNPFIKLKVLRKRQFCNELRNLPTIKLLTTDYATGHAHF